MRRKAPEMNSVRSVERALKILNLLATHPRGTPLSTISQELKLNVSTVHRLLSTLMASHYVSQDGANGRYRLGPAVIELGQELLDNMDLRKEAEDLAHSLMESVGEVVNLAVPYGTEMVYVDVIEPVTRKHGLVMRSRIGVRVPMYCTALGKAALAFLPEDTLIKVILHGLEKLTANTIAQENNLREHLELVRQNGFAIDNEECDLGLVCVGAPIFGYKGRVIAAISVTVPSVRINPERLDSIIPKVRETAREISKRMGARV